MAAVLFSSCSQSASNGNDNQNNQQEDSLVKDSTQTPQEEVQEKVIFQSPDLSFFSAKGNVKTIFSNKYQRIDFDEKGNLTKSNLMDVYMEEYIEGTYDYIANVKKDEDGRINQYLKYGDPYEIKYKDNLVVKAISYGMDDYYYEYEYNQDNLPIKESSYCIMDGKKADENVNLIKYTKFDSFGNWIERTINRKNTAYTDSYVEKRYIIYYNEENLLPDGYGSPDESYFECSGPVKKITDKYQTLEFNRKGELILLDGKNPFAARPEQFQENDITYYTRDKEGKIIKWESPYSFGECIWDGGQLVRTISFEEGGIVVQSEYFYNLDNFQAKKYRNRECDYEEYEKDKDILGSKKCTDEDITDIKLDSHGNWISRKVGEEIIERSIEYFE